MSWFHLFLTTIFARQSIVRCDPSHVINKRLDILEKEIILLKQRYINSEYCQLLPDDICGPCVCRDNDELKKNIIAIIQFTT